MTGALTSSTASSLISSAAGASFSTAAGASSFFSSARASLFSATAGASSFFSSLTASSTRAGSSALTSPRRTTASSALAGSSASTSWAKTPAGMDWNARIIASANAITFIFFVFISITSLRCLFCRCSFVCSGGVFRIGYLMVIGYRSGRHSTRHRTKSVRPLFVTLFVTLLGRLFSPHTKRELRSPAAPRFVGVFFDYSTDCTSANTSSLILRFTSAAFSLLSWML